MLLNYLIIAIRTLRRNASYTVINLFSFVLGLTIFVLGGLIVKYEQTHDLFFENSDRIYTVGMVFKGEGIGGSSRDITTYSAVGPLIDAEVGDLEAVARVLIRPRVLTIGDEKINQAVRFADPAFLQIFKFEFIAGDASVLHDPSSMILTESTALRHFGRADALGETITLDNQLDLRVAAVIRDVPTNSHFNSSLVFDNDFEFLAPLSALSMVSSFNIEGRWGGIWSWDHTYVLLPATLDVTWLDAQLGALFDRHKRPDEDEMALGFYASPLVEANLSIFQNIGIPVTSIIQLLSLLVLVIVCVNYTNLATAQALGRSREVGLRKTMGASRVQLLAQFQVESLVITSVGMLGALACLELLIPAYNKVTGRALVLSYASELPTLILTAVLVGLAAGAYPAWVITRSSPIAALRDENRQGRQGAWVRSLMLGAQFAISAFMLALVVVVYAQNLKVEESSYVFPRDETYALQLSSLKMDDKQSRLETLSRELEALPEVDGVALASTVPFATKWSATRLARDKDGSDTAPQINQLYVAPEFVELYDIEILAGRNFNRDINSDRHRSDEPGIYNVLINELAVSTLGFDSPQSALGQRIYGKDDDKETTEMVVVGVLATLPHLGQVNLLRPQVFFMEPEKYSDLSIRLRAGGSMLEAVEAIEEVWEQVIPEYPISGKFLSDVFLQLFNILTVASASLAGFASVALLLALVGLFGVTAFMAAQRTKEIGIRKSLGASTASLVGLMLWRFLRPVLLALALALPCAFIATSLYLDIFSEDRITTQVPILVLAGLTSILLAVLTVGGRVLKVARSNPVLALRHE
ncbi:MAG: ABC transporter permease [Pseudomonadota bacterium]